MKARTARGRPRRRADRAAAGALDGPGGGAFAGGGSAGDGASAGPGEGACAGDGVCPARGETRFAAPRREPRLPFRAATAADGTPVRGRETDAPGWHRGLSGWHSVPSVKRDK